MIENYPKKLTLEEVAQEEGFDSIDELLNQYGSESVMPACCEEGCRVEPDGKCPHGHFSILIEFGIIW